MQRDYYEVLGIGRDADTDGVKRAYRRLALKYHPDRNPDDPEAEERFKEATEAYEVLRDPERRAMYDRYGHQGVKAGAGGAQGFGFGSFEDALEVFMREFGGFGFEEFFGGRRRGRTETRGADLKVRVRLSLEDAHHGVTRKLNIPVLDTCAECEGTGARAGGQPTRCPQCGGTGELRQVQRSLFGQFVRVGPCAACGGRGHVIRDPCPACKGEGRQRHEKTFELDIPPGVETADYLTLRGQGNLGPRGGPRGDVLVVIEVEDDPRFQRRGADLLYDLSLTFSQAALGTTVDVPSVTRTLKVKVPPGVQTGHVLRLRGKGLPRLRGSGHGDLLVRVAVITPSEITPEQRELFEKLAQLERPLSAEGDGAAGFWQKLKDAFSA